MSGYRAVLFDVGDTLIRASEPFGVTYREVFRRLDFDLDADRLGAGLRLAGTTMDRDLPTGADRYRQFAGGEREYWSRFAEIAVSHATDGDLPPDLIERSIDRLRDHFRQREAWHIFPETRDVLTNLRARGVKLAVVSNWDSRLPAILDLLDLADPFDSVVVSALVGAEKPSPEIFAVALGELGVSAGDCLHVGDRDDMDGIGARDSGIDVRIIDRDGSGVGNDGEFPRISTLEAVLDDV